MGGVKKKKKHPKGLEWGTWGRETLFYLSAWLFIYVCITFSGWLSPEQMADSGGQPQLTQVSTPATCGVGY